MSGSVLILTCAVESVSSIAWFTDTVMATDGVMTGCMLVATVQIDILTFYNVCGMWGIRYIGRSSLDHVTVERCYTLFLNINSLMHVNPSP